MSATWLICVPTVPARRAVFERLMAALLPQTERHRGNVKVMGWLNVGTPRLAEIRDRMIEYADAQAFEYVSFIDDDDMVPAHFVMEAVMAIEQHRPDHVGFWVEYFRDGIFQGDVEHSLNWRRWATLAMPPKPHRGGERVWPPTWRHRRAWERFPRDYRLVRDFTHIDSLRTEIARWGRFADARPYAAEDRVWCRSLRERLAQHHGSREVFIDKIMYHYFWTPSQSIWDDAAKSPLIGRLTELGQPSTTHPHFFWHKESL